jgi:tetratricopeptide (TPR) repeat protein
MLIPYLIIILSLAGIIYIVFKKVPILVKLPQEPDASLPQISWRAKTLDMIKDQIAHPNYWLAFLGELEKTLRKIRIIFLKLDTFFISLIAKSRERSKDLTLKSKSWMSERRMLKIERLKLLADLRRTPEEREEVLLRILKQNPKDVKAYKDLGLLYVEQKNLQDGKSAFEEVLKINPDDEVAKANLEEIKNIENGGAQNQKVQGGTET